MDVFISHAPTDKAHLARLEVHLGLMVRQGLIRTWHRANVEPGQEAAQEIAARLGAARMVLLMVSAQFLAHDDCYEGEMKRALARHDAGEARVVPILLHDCDWASAPFARLMPLPPGGKPVTSWRNRHEAWAAVARGVRVTAEWLRGRADQDVGAGLEPPVFESQFGRPSPPALVGSSMGCSAAVPSSSHFGPPSKALPPPLPPGNIEHFGPPPRPRGSWDDLTSTPVPPDAPIDEDEIMLLLRRVTEGPVLIWSPDRAGNIGLACCLAQELAPHYGPKVQVELLRGTAEPLDPDAAMACVISALNPLFREHPPPQRWLRGQCQVDVAMYRPILILNNARDAAQVTPFLPPAGGIVLITSEQPLELPDVYTHQVERRAIES